MSRISNRRASDWVGGANSGSSASRQGCSGENSRTIFPKVCQRSLPQTTFNYLSLRLAGGRGQGEGCRRSEPVRRTAHLVSGIFGKVSGRTAVRSSRPSPDLSPFPPEAYPAGERGTDPVSSFKPEQLLGRQSPDEQGREWEDATARQDCRHRCFQAEGRGVHSLAATAAVRAEHAAGRSGVDCLVAGQRGRAGGDGSQRRL